MKDNTNMSLREALQEAFSFAKSHGMGTDGVKWLLREQLEYDDTQLLMASSRSISNANLKQFKSNVKKYVEGLPPQYIIGHEWFFNRQFKVNENVLIPRPETEELVDTYLKFAQASSQQVLDIGTGSGAIAITAKLERPQDDVWAVDLSKLALETAQTNAQLLQADISFIQSDLFEKLEGKTFDVILSNPPYISSDEWAIVDDSVKEYEPEMALLAEDNGLAIYKEIAKHMPNFLKKSGFALMEIGYQQGISVQTIFQKTFPLRDISILKDMSGHDRMIYIEQLER